MFCVLFPVSSCDWLIGWLAMWSFSLYLPILPSLYYTTATYRRRYCIAILLHAAALHFKSLRKQQVASGNAQPITSLHTNMYGLPATAVGAGNPATYNVLPSAGAFQYPSKYSFFIFLHALFAIQFMHYFNDIIYLCIRATSFKFLL